MRTEGTSRHHRMGTRLHAVMQDCLLQIASRPRRILNQFYPGNESAKRGPHYLSTISSASPTRQVRLELHLLPSHLQHHPSVPQLHVFPSHLQHHVASLVQSNARHGRVVVVRHLERPWRTIRVCLERLGDRAKPLVLNRVVLCAASRKLGSMNLRSAQGRRRRRRQRRTCPRSIISIWNPVCHPSLSSTPILPLLHSPSTSFWHLSSHPLLHSPSSSSLRSPASLPRSARAMCSAPLFLKSFPLRSSDSIVELNCSTSATCSAPATACPTDDRRLWAPSQSKGD